MAGLDGLLRVSGLPSELYRIGGETTMRNAIGRSGSPQPDLRTGCTVPRVRR